MQFKDLDWDLLSSYAGLLTLATVSIYAGSYSSLPNPKSSDDDSEEGHGEGEEDDDGERMTLHDAYLFPIIGSIALVGLYLIVKYFGDQWINWFLGWYFSIAGVGSVWKSSISLLRFLVGDATWKKFDKFNVTAKKGAHPLFSLTWRTPSLWLLPLAIIPSSAYHFWTAGRRSILVTDILGLSFSHNALALLKLDSFKTGSILLCGLFVYDIWWVFGTQVMVHVATTLDLPIKVLWPKSLAFASDRGYTMLGLGDIVIPGTFVALGLRYDYERYTRGVAVSDPDPKKKARTVTKSSFGSYGKPYFWAALTAYVLGLVTTMVVMHMFGKAQPALLYLSPACIASFFVTAAIRGELADAWSWSDLPEEVEQGGSIEIDEAGKGDDEVQQGDVSRGDIGNGDAETSRNGVLGVLVEEEVVKTAVGDHLRRRVVAAVKPMSKSLGRR